MLFTSARLKPCKAFAWASSPWRLTTILPSWTLRLVRRGSSQLSLPLGPSTETRWPLTSTFTLGGMAIGCFPISDINETFLPHVTKQFPAQVLFARLVAGHDPFGGRKHRHTQTAPHAGDVRGTHIAAKARRANPA